MCRKLFPTFARWLESLGWPILRRQLRADFRRSRFFILHFASLSALALALVFYMTVKVDEESLDPTRVGQSLFSTFFLFQAAIVILVFPAFGATAFSEERSNLSLDLLLTSTLQPVEIVWGKFLAASVYSLMYIIGSAPLISIAFTFGRIPPSEALAGYALLIACTLFISLLGVAISSASRSNIASTLATYAAVLLSCVAAFFLLFKGASMELIPKDKTVVRQLLEAMEDKNGVVPMNLLALVAGFLAVCAYLFLFATNRIRPASSDRSSALRVLTFIVVPGWLATRAWAASGGSPRNLNLVAFSVEAAEKIVLLTAAFLFTAALVFPTEEARVPRRAQARFGRFRGLRFPLRVFCPGAFWGFAYVAVMAAGVCFYLLSLWLWLLPDGAAGGRERRLVESLLTLPFCVGAFAALGFCLASFDFTPRYSRLTVLFTFIIVLLLPLIFYLRNTPDTLWTLYYLSPATLWFSLDTAPPSMDAVKFTLYGLPAVKVAKIVYGTLIFIFLAAGVRACRRADRPLIRLAPAPLQPAS